MPDPLDDLAAEPAAAEALALAAADLVVAATTATPGEPRLREHVLAAAMTARPAGRPAVAVVPTTPTAAFRRTLHELGETILGLNAVDGSRPAVEGWTVAGLIGHITAIEEHFGATLGWWAEAAPVGLEHDHLAMTLPAVERAQGLSIDEVRAAWRAVADRVLTRIGSLDERQEERVMFHGFDFSIRSLLIARTFELWTHSEDIARAIGRPAPALDLSRLQLMTDAAVRALPIGMLLTGREPAGRSVRVVLTGDGGGSWVQSLELGGMPPETGPVLTLVADAVDFCRLAAKRRKAEDLDFTVIGDADLAMDVLIAAAVFAA